MAARRIVDIIAVAAYLATTERHVRRLVDTRKIPFHHVGRKVRFDLDAIDVWLDEHKVEAAS